MTHAAIVLTTIGDEAAAEVLARRLIEERLAACIHVGGALTSIYRWKGAVERETEHQLVIKTSRDRLGALEARIRELHPYELPEFIVLDVAAGSEAYLAWVEAETRHDGSR